MKVCAQQGVSSTQEVEPPTQPSTPRLALEEGRPCWGRAAEGVGAGPARPRGSREDAEGTGDIDPRPWQARFVEREARLRLCARREGGQAPRNCLCCEYPGLPGTLGPLCRRRGRILHTSAGSQNQDRGAGLEGVEAQRGQALPGRAPSGAPAGPGPRRRQAGESLGPALASARTRSEHPRARRLWRPRENSPFKAKEV